MSFDSIESIIDDIRLGKMVVLLDDEDRENEGDLIMAASKVRPEDINFMAKEARGLICLALTRERCRQLRLPPMVSDNQSPMQTNFTVSIEAAEGVSTGISAYDRAHTIRTAVAPDAAAEDLHQPGHVFPLAAHSSGVLARAGHTEAAVDLARLAGLEPAGVLVEIMHDDGSMARRPELEIFAKKHQLKIGSIADLIRFRMASEKTVERVFERQVQTQYGDFQLIAFRNLGSTNLHFAMTRGTWTEQSAVLTRVHVQNPLSDVMQLNRSQGGISAASALARIARENNGVMVILMQSPNSEEILQRLQTESISTKKDANEWRNTGLGAQILHELGVKRLRVIGTPRKFTGLSGFGLEVVEYLDPEAANAAQS